MSQDTIKGLNSVREGKYRRKIIFLFLFELFVVFWILTFVVCVFFCINVYFHALFILIFIRDQSVAYHKLKPS